jgi:hypothetical protein
LYSRRYPHAVNHSRQDFQHSIDLLLGRVPAYAEPDGAFCGSFVTA